MTLTDFLMFAHITCKYVDKILFSLLLFTMNRECQREQSTDKCYNTIQSGKEKLMEEEDESKDFLSCKFR